MKITFRPAKREDIPQLVGLFNAQYARKKDEPYYLWQYFGSFYPTVCFCAFNEDVLIGAFGLQKRRLTDGTIIGHLIDLLVAPEWKKHGIFKALGTKAIEYFPGLEALSVLPNQNGRMACEKSFGLRTLAKIDDLVIKDESSIDHVIHTQAHQENLVRYEGGSEFENWRYNQNPGYRYERTTLSDGSYTVAKLFTDPGTGEKFWDIVDYRLAGAKAEIINLFLTAIQTLSKRDKSSISTWALPHTPLNKILTVLGARPLARERYFCVKVLNPKREYLYDINRWDLVPADAEIY